MTPRETIKSSVLNYPLISSTNGEIQHHLFIEIGNGFEWANGELVDESDNKGAQSINDAICKIFNDYNSKDNGWFDVLKRTTDVKRFFQYILKYIKSDVLTILKADTMFDEPLEVYFDKIKEPLLFDISRYSKIYNLPNEMTKEWYDCVVNFLNHFEPYINDTEEQRKYISEIKKKLKTIKVI